MDINADIAEKIMEWQVDRAQRLYRDPAQRDGAFKPLPDFLLRDHELLRQTMRDRGYELVTIGDPPGFRGKMFTASFRRREESFLTTQPDERQAVCVAALKVYGLQISNDQ